VSVRGPLYTNVELAAPKPKAIHSNGSVDVFVGVVITDAN
jgi:hypothetical protein